MNQITIKGTGVYHQNCLIVDRSSEHVRNKAIYKYLYIGFRLIKTLKQ